MLPKNGTNVLEKEVFTDGTDNLSSKHAEGVKVTDSPRLSCFNGR
jgi:hypothetical protein